MTAQNNDQPWWSPEALAEREREIRSGVGDESGDMRNDFASYKALADGKDATASGLYMHNECEPWRINTVCRDYGRIVRSVLRRSPRAVADFGCGAGFTTDGLQRMWPTASVYGFDVSIDAVSFAQRQWPKCRFVAGAITPGTSLEGGPFDVILCQEFYPFTRTSQLESHREWLRLLAQNMTPDGVALIMVSAGTDGSINDTFSQLQSEFSLQRVRVAAPRVARRLPSSLVQTAGQVLLSVKPAWVRNLYVLTK
jgi:SAM-dependent methyltransferase